jgi:hypothetical protein
MQAPRGWGDERVWGAISFALLAVVLVIDAMTDRTLSTSRPGDQLDYPVVNRVVTVLALVA